MLTQSALFDLGVAIRSLRRSPGFLAAAVVSLGLAIGAGIAGFSVLDAVRFRALPFPNADRLVLISEVPANGCANVCDVNYKTLALLRTHRVFVDRRTCRVYLRSKGAGHRHRSTGRRGRHRLGNGVRHGGCST